VDDSLVQQVVEAVLDFLAEFRSQHPAFAGVGASTMISASISLPLHPGAEAAYRARGLITEE
jgi:TRAP-type uncharacterized transport system substrate-binding protein